MRVTVSGQNGVRERTTPGSEPGVPLEGRGGGQAPMREWEILLEREIISLFNPHSYSRLD